MLQHEANAAGARFMFHAIALCTILVYRIQALQGLELTACIVHTALRARIMLATSHVYSEAVTLRHGFSTFEAVPTCSPLELR